MSGHSHAKTVKRKKDASAIQRSKMFAKLSKELAIVSRESGSDPASNPRLRMIIEKARSFNMPSDNIDRAIKRGSGEGETAHLEEILLDAYGPGGAAVLILSITDNKKRALGEIKQVVDRAGGKLVEEGAVRWMFARKGVLVLAPEQGSFSQDDLELAAIEAGAEDTLRYQDGALEIICDPTRLSQVQEALAAKGITAEEAAIEWVPKERVALSEEDQAKYEAFSDALDEHEDVQEVYSNTAS
ncbi:MAG: YebC/PmpR family DNA-binding transcriptional regulator [Candidatus Yanofskybacteria bacterium]|nr:YebC/PmpR family DNA-binding transcriptional regulator [Candidatus Yanofskybacteria bacterium]